MRMPPLPADSIHARACKLKCEKILTRPYWQLRVNNPQTSREILRNIFCVAASRGKQHIIFVNNGESMLSEESLYAVGVDDSQLKNMDISKMFLFKY